MALAWNGVNSPLLIAIVTAAMFGGEAAEHCWEVVHTLSDWMLPTSAPAIRTSSPPTANAALSKIARTR